MKLSHWGVALSLCSCLALIGCGQPQPTASSTGAAASESVDAHADETSVAAVDDSTAPAANGTEAPEATDEATETEAEMVVIEPGPDAQKAAQEALIYAEEGDVIEFAAGEFKLTKTLSLDGKKHVTIRGQGMDKTILNFADQQKGTGGEGILIKNADDFTIEDITPQDTPGDAIKVDGAHGLTMRRVKTWWSNGPHAENGVYGLYPVLSEKYLDRGLRRGMCLGCGDLCGAVEEHHRPSLPRRKTWPASKSKTASVLMFMKTSPPTIRAGCWFFLCPV